MVRDGGMVTCLEAKTGKPHFEQERLGALGSYYPSPVAADGRIYICSNDGKITVLSAGDKPEVLYRARASIIADSADLQSRLLERSADWLRPGGSLVYSVCSLEPEEGEQRIEAFLSARADFRIEPPPLLADGVTPHSGGWLRVLPGMLEAEGGLDGFFTVHLVRTA
jgi:16S rRNA C967 or C1407 C5-methylase (RsmB/RsmF family)